MEELIKRIEKLEVELKNLKKESIFMHKIKKSTINIIYKGEKDGQDQ